MIDAPDEQRGRRDRVADATIYLLASAITAVTLAKTSLVFSAIVDIVVYATPYSPNNRPPGDATIILAASLLYYGIWFVYLVRSKRVQETYS